MKPTLVYMQYRKKNAPKRLSAGLETFRTAERIWSAKGTTRGAKEANAIHRKQRELGCVCARARAWGWSARMRVCVWVLRVYCVCCVTHTAPSLILPPAARIRFRSVGSSAPCLGFRSRHLSLSFDPLTGALKTIAYEQSINRSLHRERD